MTTPIPATYKFGQIVSWNNPRSSQRCPAIICNVRADGTCDLHVFGWDKSAWTQQTEIVSSFGTGPGQFTVI